jgi:hypothetical protein
VRRGRAEWSAFCCSDVDRELIEHATEIRMRAEIRAGELLREMEKNKGARSQLKGGVPVGDRAPKPPRDTVPTLKDLGVTKSQSSRWQKVAALPKDEQEEKIADTKRKAVLDPKPNKWKIRPCRS